MRYLITILLILLPVFSHAQTTIQTATATLTWDSNTEPDIDSYIIMMGESTGFYSQTKPITHMRGVERQTGVFPSLVEGKTYFFVVKSCDAIGNCSGPSQEVSGSVRIKPDVTAPGDPSGVGVTFEINIDVKIQ